MGTWARLSCAAALMALAPLPLAAQDEPRPLEFEVRPSGVLAESPDEALDRRLKQREYLFRSICRNCGRGDRFSSDAPFKPFQALAAPAPGQD